MIKRDVPAVHISATEVGEIIAGSDSYAQREALLAWARVTETFDWCSQCFAIVNGVPPRINGLTAAERNRIRYMLSTLMEHLEHLEYHVRERASCCEVCGKSLSEEGHRLCGHPAPPGGPEDPTQSAP